MIALQYFDPIRIDHLQECEQKRLVSRIAAGSFNRERLSRIKNALSKETCQKSVVLRMDERVPKDTIIHVSIGYPTHEMVLSASSVFVRGGRSLWIRTPYSIDNNDSFGNRAGSCMEHVAEVLEPALMRIAVKPGVSKSAYRIPIGNKIVGEPLSDYELSAQNIVSGDITVLHYDHISNKSGMKNFSRDVVCSIVDSLGQNLKVCSLDKQGWEIPAAEAFTLVKNSKIVVTNNPDIPVISGALGVVCILVLEEEISMPENIDWGRTIVVSCDASVSEVKSNIELAISISNEARKLDRFLASDGRSSERVASVIEQYKREI